jgi:acetyl esterase/lipase
MPLDPQARMLLDQMQAMGLPPLDALPVPEARAAIMQMVAAAGPPEPVARVENRTVPGPAGEIPVRLYAPEAKGPLPVLVYYHGGGWVIGNLDSHDGVCRQLANAAGCLVVSVDYRLAPEHPYPAAAEDAYAAARWVAAHAASLGGDPARVAVGGDSAGGNLSAVVSQMARDRGGPRLVYQLLIYPVVDAPGDERASYRDNADGYFLTATSMHWFWNHYQAGKPSCREPYACPLRATDLRGLPPALVITAEFDPLRDEAEEYAAKLHAADVPVTLTRYDGMIHGFFGMAALLDQAKVAVAEAVDGLKRAFAR